MFQFASSIILITIFILLCSIKVISSLFFLISYFPLPFVICSSLLRYFSFHRHCFSSLILLLSVRSTLFHLSSPFFHTTISNFQFFSQIFQFPSPLLPIAISSPFLLLARVDLLIIRPSLLQPVMGSYYWVADSLCQTWGVQKAGGCRTGGAL